MIQDFENSNADTQSGASLVPEPESALDAHDETIYNERSERSCDVNSSDNFVNGGRKNTSVEGKNTDTESVDSTSGQPE